MVFPPCKVKGDSLKLEPEFVWDIYCCAPHEIVLLRMIEMSSEREPRVGWRTQLFYLIALKRGAPFT